MVDWTFMEDILLPAPATSAESNAAGVEKQVTPAIESLVNDEELEKDLASVGNAENQEPKKASGTPTTKSTSRYRSALHRLREKNA